ncbi:MAG: hypothetical protein U1F43_31440 [Myxococcota bacterium]
MSQLTVWAPQLLLELQLAVLPPPWPVHDQVKGPAPETAVGVPAEHRPVPGAAAVLPLLAAAGAGDDLRARRAGRPPVALAAGRRGRAG